MKLLYLGTAAAEAIPALFCECEACQKARSLGRAGVRGRAGSLLAGVLKIDFGPDSYRQMLDNGLSYAKIHSVLITHTHEDHLAVDELALRRQVTAHIHTEPKLMTVYGNAAVGEKLRSVVQQLVAPPVEHPLRDAVFIAQFADPAIASQPLQDDCKLLLPRPSFLLRAHRSPPFTDSLNIARLLTGCNIAAW